MNESERDPLGVTIGAREIYDQLVGMREDVRNLTQAQEGVSRTLADQEDRLRALERWKYAIPPTVVMAVGSLVSALLGPKGK
ncbi:hypothetical protein ACFC0S_03145 [Streptomyces sp. NPDC056084]|uniref:hypothetical protein n=1 Tax=unclassified Streptomyces TaxID=2593676 RepID=UPI0035D57690